MAVDTVSKRGSALAWGLPFRTLPIPDSATLSASDRLHVALMYTGVTADYPQSARSDEIMLRAPYDSSPLLRATQQSDTLAVSAVRSSDYSPLRGR